MTNLEKLSIKGIRCFSPQSVNSISFLNPLTLILGPNGSGKTTIIECLKYICTGSLPPNTKNGASFIFDPKLINQSDVKAQIKLIFQNIKNKSISCSRSMQLSLKKNKTEVRTLENILCMGEGEDKVTSSSKCVEIDKEMIYHLGVNTALIENVIFCHQEDSVWILDDPKIVKKKMDDIFASTKYIKALESLKVQKRELSSEIKVKKQELEFLYHQKSQKDKLIQKIKEINEKLFELEEKNKIFVFESEKCCEIKLELKNEIKILEEAEKTYFNYRIELRNLQNFVNTFSYEILNDNVINDIISFNFNTLLTKIQDMEIYLSEINKKINLKRQEKEEYFFIKQKEEFYKNNNQINHEKILKLKKNKYDNLLIFYKEIKKLTNEFVDPSFSNFLTHFLNEDFLENEENLGNIKEENLLIDQSKLTELKKYNKKMLDCVKNKIDNLRSKERIENEKNESFNSKITNLNLEIKYMEDQLNELSFYDFNDLENLTLEIINSKIENINLENIKLNIKKLENEILIKENLFYEKYEEDLKLQIKRKRFIDIETCLNNLIDGMLKHFISIEEFNMYEKYDLIFICEKNKLEKIIKEENLLKVKKEEEKIKEKFVKSEKNKKIENLKNQIRNNLTVFNRFNKKNSMQNELEIFKLNDFNDLERRLNEINENITSNNNSTFIYNSLKNKGKENNECPLCEKILINDDLINFSNKIDNFICSIPLTLKNLLEERKNLEQTILNLKNTNKILEERNEYVDLHFKLVNEIKCYVNFNSLDHFLDDEEFLSEDFSSDSSNIFELEERFKEIKNHESLFNEYKMLQSEFNSSNNFDLENLKKEINYDKNKLKDLKNNLEIKSKELEELENKRKKLHIKKEIEEKINNFKNREKCLEEINNKINILKNNQVKTLKNLNLIKEEIEELNSLYNNTWESSFKIENYIQTYFNELLLLINEINRNNKLKKELKKINFNEEDFLMLENIYNKTKDKLEKEKKNLLEKQKLKETAEENIKLKESKKKIESLKLYLKNDDPEQLEIYKEKYEKINDKLMEIENKKSMNLGEINQLKEMQVRQQKELNFTYKETEEKFLIADTSFKVLEVILDDLDKAIKSVDKSIIEFHSKKIEEVNKSLKTLWMNTYKGNDIDLIELKAESIDQKSYNYKLVMIKNNTELEMRSRSSAGQKIICSILFRLALVEAFSKDCSFLALDEPTTNLDEYNMESLAKTLSEIIEQKRDTSFQLIIITHDEKFVNLLTRHSIDEYYFINKKSNGSVIELKRV